MVVDWKVTIFFDGKLWRWRATTDGYLGLSGTAETEDDAEEAARLQCRRTVLARVEGSRETRQFIVSVDEADLTG